MGCPFYKELRDKFFNRFNMQKVGWIPVTGFEIKKSIIIVCQTAMHSTYNIL